MIRVLILAGLTGITYIVIDELGNFGGNPIYYAALGLVLALLFDIWEEGNDRT